MRFKYHLPPARLWLVCFTVAAATVLHGPAAAVAQVGPMWSIVAELESYAQQLLAESKVPGLAVAVVSTDEVLYTGGFGVKDVLTQEPVDADTIFEIGSCSKAFTSTLMAMLVDEGRLAWDDRVSAYLPKFRMYDPWVTKQFQIVDLMSQRSGLRGYALDSMAIFGFPTQEVIHAVRYVKPETSFRSSYAYQNTLFAAAGRVIEKAEGDSWENVVSRRLFTPLGMTRSTAFESDLPALGNTARGHIILDDGSIFRIPDGWVYQDFLEIYAAAGGIRSSVVDMAKWVRMQLGLGVFEQQRLVSENNLIATHTPRIEVSTNDTQSLSYANGWIYQAQTPAAIIWHNGATLSMHSIVGFVPAIGLGLVVLTNSSENSIPEDLLSKLYALYYQHSSLEAVDPAAAKESFPMFDRLPGAGRYARAQTTHRLSFPHSAPLVGKYKNPAYGIFKVYRQGEALKVAIGPKPLRADLQRTGRRAFILQPPDYPINFGAVRFEGSINGRARRMVVDTCSDARRGIFRRIR